MRVRLALIVAAAARTAAHDAPGVVDRSVYEDAVSVLADVVASALWREEEAADDPINAFTLDYPRDGEVLPPSFEVVCSVRVDSQEAYNARYAGATLCVELNGVVAQCTPLLQSHLPLENLKVGTYTARVFILMRSTHRRETQSVSFSVIDDGDLTAHADQAAGRLRWKHAIPADQDLFSWARSIRIDDVAASTTPLVDAAPTLVIGVKTALRTNFHQRQAIRETWASTTSLPNNTRVIFIGCRPALDVLSDRTDRKNLEQAIATEKRVFGDLLTDELDCDDSYADLPKKVSEFIRWAIRGFDSSLTFVMIADDDIYLRTDMLQRELELLPNHQRVYAGQVWSTMFNRPSRSVRDTTSRYYLPEEIYPMQTLPPFAFGPHYVLSVDCAKFIAKNGHRLRGLAAMDDISVALWMLATQVHPQHIQRLRNVRASSCKDDLISLADLSSLGIRVIHSNLNAGRDFCTDFDSTVWKKAETQDADDGAAPQLALTSTLRDIRVSRVVEVITTVNSIDFSYVPSIETLSHFSDRVCEHLKQVLSSLDLTCDQVRDQLTNHHRLFYSQVVASDKIDASRTELWRHNLFSANPDSPTVHIGYTGGASFSHTLFECLFTAVYRSSPVLVARMQTLESLYGVQPDVAVFSMLDTDCPSRQKCPVPSFTSTKSDRNPLGKVLMFSGESWTTARLDKHVVLLSTVSDAPQASQHVYLSMASASFAERLDHSPLDLLAPWTNRKGVEGVQLASPRRFCAFLYSQCDWPHRQYFYDVLNAIETVDAIGKCAGALEALDRTHKLASRRSSWYLDDAVNQYEQFKFVIAFENSIAPGYVTEKIANAFLAGAVPIYWGNSTSVASLFNSRSYIDCGTFATLRECATRVLEVHRSDELYEAMRHEPPIVDLDAFREAFSWHPSIESDVTAVAIARHLFR